MKTPCRNKGELHAPTHWLLIKNNVRISVYFIQKRSRNNTKPKTERQKYKSSKTGAAVLRGERVGQSEIKFLSVESNCYVVAKELVFWLHDQNVTSKTTWSPLVWFLNMDKWYCITRTKVKGCESKPSHSVLFWFFNGTYPGLHSHSKPGIKLVQVVEFKSHCAVPSVHSSISTNRDDILGLFLWDTPLWSQGYAIPFLVFEQNSPCSSQ